MLGCWVAAACPGPEYKAPSAATEQHRCRETARPQQPGNPATNPRYTRTLHIDTIPSNPHSAYDRIYATVKRIPRGRVATYGQIATLAGLDGHARQVGYALHNLDGRTDVPWHRVINARGEVSPRSAGDSHELQRMLLEAEGVKFSKDGRVMLEKYRWSKN